MQHVDPTRPDPRIPPTFLYAATRAALHETIARKRQEAKERDARNPQRPPFVERRKEPRILGFNGAWTPEMRRAEAHMAANERRFTDDPITGWVIL